MKFFKRKTGSSASTKLEAQGQDYLNIFVDRPWNTDDLTVEKVKRYEEDFFVQLVLSKLSGLIFLGKPIINVIDNTGKSREDIAEWFRVMTENIRLSSLMETSFNDLNVWGNYIYSVGVGTDQKGHIVITEVRRLPPATFGTRGGTYSVDNVHGKLLPGISKDTAGDVHYWQQRRTGIPVELTNCQHVKAKGVSDYVDGVPAFAPLYKLIPTLTFLKDGMMIANNRDNIMFLRPASDGAGGTFPTNLGSLWDYLGSVLRSFSRSLLHILPAGTDIVEPTRPVSDFSLKSLDMVVKWVMNFYSASDIIAKGDGTLVGGSSRYEAELAKNFSKSNQNFIIGVWEQILNDVLTWNGYEGYRVEIIMEELKFHNDELDFKIASDVLKAATQSGYCVASINEVRNLFGFEDASDAYIEESKQEWLNAAIKKTPVEPVVEAVKTPEEVAETEPQDQNQ